MTYEQAAQEIEKKNDCRPWKAEILPPVCLDQIIIRMIHEKELDIELKKYFYVEEK